MRIKLAIVWSLVTTSVHFLVLTILQVFIAGIITGAAALLLICYSGYGLVVVSRKFVRGFGFLTRLMVLAVFAASDRQMPDMRR